MNVGDLKKLLDNVPDSYAVEIEYEYDYDGSTCHDDKPLKKVDTYGFLSIVTLS